MDSARRPVGETKRYQAGSREYLHRQAPIKPGNLSLDLRREGSWQKARQMVTCLHLLLQTHAPHPNIGTLQCLEKWIDSGQLLSSKSIRKKEG